MMNRTESLSCETLPLVRLKVCITLTPGGQGAHTRRSTICGWNKLKTFPFISVGKHEFEKSWNEKTQDTTAYFKTHFFKVLKNPGYCGGTNYNVAGMSYSIYEHIKQKLHLLNCSSSLGASKNGF